MDDEGKEALELAKKLLRSSLRAFYDTRHGLVIDALMRHSALRDDDLAYLMSMNTKDLHKLCGKLREDRFLVTHVRSEIRDGQQRPVNRTYYYIDFRQTVDAIKWRVFKIDKDLQGTTVPASEKKEYVCPKCGSQWTQMEVLDSFGPFGFLCHRCNSVLVHAKESQSSEHHRSTRMHNQYKFITDLLPEIDKRAVPECTFDIAFENRIPIVRDATHQIAASTGVDAINRPTAVKGLANTGPSKMSVEISSTNGPSEEEKAAELARRERIAQQNALPAWMSNSTITGEAFRLADTTSALAKKEAADVKVPTAKAAIDANDDADIEMIFERMKQQRAEEERRKALKKEEESSDEEDEDFEDVVGPGTNSAGGTPASLSAAPPAKTSLAPSPLRQSSLKREASSGSGSAVGSPAYDDRPAKKVKVEEPPPADDESDDEIEFEDV